MTEFSDAEIEAMYQSHLSDLAHAHLKTLPKIKLTDGVVYVQCVCGGLIAPEIQVRHAVKCVVLRHTASAAELARNTPLTAEPPRHSAECADAD